MSVILSILCLATKILNLLPNAVLTNKTSGHKLRIILHWHGHGNVTGGVGTHAHFSATVPSLVTRILFPLILPSRAIKVKEPGR